jgi:hypothetical protein
MAKTRAQVNRWRRGDGCTVVNECRKLVKKRKENKHWLFTLSEEVRAPRLQQPIQELQG